MLILLGTIASTMPMAAVSATSEAVTYATQLLMLGYADIY